MTRARPTLARVVAALLRRSVFDGPDYREAELRRLLNLFAHVDLGAWRGLRVLEVGAGSGRIGDVFAQLGFDVTSSDGRPEHVERMLRRGRRAVVLDLDAGDLSAAGEVDVVLAFGVLYHLAHPERFLRACGARARVLVLESVVTDALRPVAPQVPERGGADQALAGVACRPSPSWVEAECRAAGFTNVRDISSAAANWATARFDWRPEDSGQWRRDGANLRRMWVAAKGPGLGA